MTTTPLDYFEKVPGTLEQLVLGTITQKLINRDYIHESLATDFTTNAITYSISGDTEENLSANSNLSLSLTFPIVPFERQILVDKPSYDLRILSLNSLNVDTLSLPQKTDYPVKSALPQLPNYLSLDVPNNTLERRLMALCLYVRAYINWIDRWNNLASYWILTKYQDQSFYNYPLAEIEIDRDALLIELATGVIFKPIPLERIFIEPLAVPITNPATAQEVLEFFSFDLSSSAQGSDPGDTGSRMSSMLLYDLQEFAGAGLNSNNNMESVGGGSPEKNEQEKPTLPNC